MKKMYEMDLSRNAPTLWDQEHYDVQLLLDESGWMEGIEQPEPYLRPLYLCGVFVPGKGLHFYEFRQQNYFGVGLASIMKSESGYQDCMGITTARIAEGFASKEELARLQQRLKAYKETMPPFFFEYYQQMQENSKYTVKEIERKFTMSLCLKNQNR